MCKDWFNRKDAPSASKLLYTPPLAYDDPLHCVPEIDLDTRFSKSIVAREEFDIMPKKTSKVAKKKRANVKKGVTKKSPALVSPTGKRSTKNVETPEKKDARRILFGNEGDSNVASAAEIHDISSPSLTTAEKERTLHLVTPSKATTTLLTKESPSAKRRLIFGRYTEVKECAPNVQTVYKIVRKLTGNLGGNGYSGPIYGELTMNSMQKMVDLMVEYTDFSSSSRFIDVGSGIGKPNLHVAQYPGVEFSCGVEMEHNRWSLGMSCLKACLNAAVVERDETLAETKENNEQLLQGSTMFMHNNILEAKTFDPFTHVYMFSIGFPPELWEGLSTMWNKSDTSACQYLICYSPPKKIIDTYDFDVELLVQIPTSMHGSKESHMGYIYRRTTSKKKLKAKTASSKRAVACDPLFKPSYNLVKSGLKELEREVDRQVRQEMGSSKRSTRSQKKTVFSKSY